MPKGECFLVGAEAWALQVGLGVLAFLSLVYKRFKEVPQRTWKIWSLDTSKQAIVSIEIHFINVGLARAMMKLGHTSDSCGWYFTMVLLDATIGLAVVYWLLRWSEWLVHRHRIEVLYSGEYGSPPRLWPWLAQLVLYNTVMLIEKGLVSLLLLLKFVQQVGKGILVPIGNVSESLELVLSLVITPFLINVIWFWLVDNFLMKDDAEKKAKRASYKFSTLKAEISPGSPSSPTSSRGRSSFSPSDESMYESLLLRGDGDGDDSELDDLDASAGYSGEYKPYRRHGSLG